MLDKMHPVLVTVLSVLEMFKASIIEARMAEATALVGEKVTIYTHDGERIDGLLKDITPLADGGYNAIIETEGATIAVVGSGGRRVSRSKKADMLDIPVFHIIKIEAYTERTTPDFDFLNRHPLTLKRVEVTTNISRYIGILKEASNNHVVIKLDGEEGLQYLSGEYSMRAL